MDYRNGTPESPLFWAGSVAGRYALQWEQQEIDRGVADVFGYHAIQLGLPQVCALQANRMPHRWTVLDSLQAALDPVGSPGVVDDLAQSPALVADFHALPFPANSVDLVVMPHTLEFCHDPHLTLREVDRVLRPEGRLLITGFNPASLWGVLGRGQRWIGRGRDTQPTPRPPTRSAADWVGYWRLRDWLRLLSFEVEGGRFGCYVPPVGTQQWQQRLQWMETLGDRWWPVLGSVYAVMAVKRVRGMRVLALPRRSVRTAAPAPAVVAQRRQRSAPPDGTAG